MIGLSDWLHKEAQKRRDEQMNTSSQWTLGQIIGELEKIPQGARIQFSDGRLPTYLESWRGVYAELSLVPYNGDKWSKPLNTVGEVLKECKNAVGRTFQGYKGGDYTMRMSTPVWVSPHGDADNIAVVGIGIFEDNVIIQIKSRDAYDF